MKPKVAKCEIKNVKDSISEFRIPGVGGVKSQDSSSQESRSREMQNNEMSKTPFRSFRYRELEDSRVKTIHHRSPEVAKCEIKKCQRLHTEGLDTRSWRCQGLSRQESRSCEVRKAKKLI
jgi:hypothetical protein